VGWCTSWHAVASPCGCPVGTSGLVLLTELRCDWGSLLHTICVGFRVSTLSPLLPTSPTCHYKLLLTACGSRALTAGLGKVVGSGARQQRRTLQAAVHMSAGLLMNRIFGQSSHVQAKPSRSNDQLTVTRYCHLPAWHQQHCRQCRSVPGGGGSAGRDEGHVTAPQEVAEAAFVVWSVVESTGCLALYQAFIPVPCVKHLFKSLLGTMCDDAVSADTVCMCWGCQTMHVHICCTMLAVGVFDDQFVVMATACWAAGGGRYGCLLHD